MRLPNQKGFTLMEMIIIVAITTTLLIITGVLFSTTIGRNQTENVTQDIVSTLRRAQWQSMNGHEDSQWGVHFESDAFTLFKGTTYSSGAADNVVTNLPNDITISTVTLNGGGVDVVFETEFGDTTDYGSIVIDQDTSLETRTVTINTVGMIDAN